MSSIFETWNKKIDVEGLKKDIETAKSNPDNHGEFKEVPEGKYEVKVEKMELKESSTHKPMVSVWFKILNGEFENNRLFMNQVVDEGWKINQFNEFLESLGTDNNIEFVDFSQYNDLILDVMEKIDGSLEYAIDYSKTKKGFSTFKIDEIFEIE